MKVTKTMVLREVAGEYILIPVGETAAEFYGMVNLNESGVLLWNRLQEECTEQDLVAILLDEYEVDEETARAGVKRFLAQMRAAGVLSAQPESTEGEEERR